MEYMGSIKVEFDISTNINAETEGQAWHKLHQIIDYLKDNVTIDCKLGSEYDVSIDECNKEQTAFINCVACGKIGEAVGNCKKGERLLVNGRIQTRSYDTQDGQKRYVTEVVADFVGKKLDSEFDSSSNFDSFEQPQNENIPF